MESASHLVSFFGLCFWARLVDTSVLVRAPSPVLVTMGREPLSLECSYQTTEAEAVIDINWYHKTTHGEDYKLIAQVPPKDMDLQPAFTDQLASRGQISTKSSGIVNTVRLQIDPVECTDEGEYECEVSVFLDQTPHKAKVQVHLNEEPAVPVLSYDSTSLIENHPVTFTCTASMGQPVGTFRWLVYKSRHGSPLEEVELPGSTSLSKPAGRCSPTGTSTLAIVVTRYDRKVKCVVEQISEEGVVKVTDESELDVKYRVTDIEIYTLVGKTDLPFSRVAVVEKREDMNFMCRAYGNPRPEFNWSYLPLNGQTGLVSIATYPGLTLKDIRVNQSGSYVCAASNVISGKEVSKTHSVRIIVKDKIASKHRKPKEVKNPVGKRYIHLLIGGLVTGALLLTVFFSALSVTCARRCSQKPMSTLSSAQALTNHTYAEIEAFDVRSCPSFSYEGNPQTEMHT